MSEKSAPWERYDRLYRDFRDEEGVPVHTGHFVEDIRKIAVSDWNRTGGRGAFINLHGMEYMCDLQVHEIPPGESLDTLQHLHEAIVFVVSGTGFTTIDPNDAAETFEWSDHALFYLPRNTPYRLANSSEDEPARLLALTTLPLLYSVLHQDEAIWGIDNYNERSYMEDQFYSSMSEQKSAEHNRTYWDANFIPNATDFDKLDSWPERGGGGRSVFFPFTSSSMFSHISEFPSGRYKKAHRHSGGANILILSGEGYTYMWKEGDDERLRIDWSPYTLFVPPTLWYHQHFNISSGYSRYMALHGPMEGLGVNDTDTVYFMNPRNQIEYHEEDPEIREQFEEELRQNGVKFQMEETLYSD